MYMPSPYRMLVRRFMSEIEAAGPSADVALDLICADAVAHVPGSGELAGDYHGPAGFVGLFASQRERAAGSYVVEVQSYDVQQTMSAAVVRIGAHRPGLSYGDTVRLVMRLDAGKIKELWLDPLDAAAFDAFF